MTEANPKPPELFPEQPKSLDSACDVRDYSINKIKKYIYGPDWEDTQKYHLMVYQMKFLQLVFCMQKNTVKNIDVPTNQDDKLEDSGDTDICNEESKKAILMIVTLQKFTLRCSHLQWVFFL